MPTMRNFNQSKNNFTVVSLVMLDSDKFHFTWDHLRKMWCTRACIEIGAGINVGDMVQPNILEPLVLAKMINITFMFGILMHFIQWLNLCSNSRTKNLMEPLNSNLIGFLSVRKLIRKHCTVRSVKSNVRRVLPYLLF